MDKTSTKEKNIISAVVYIHNAEGSINTFLNMLCEFLRNGYEKYEIICVDDASEDKSASIIRDFASEVDEGTLSILTMSYFQGLELSMDAGVDLAIGDFVYEFDSPVISYPKEILGKVYAKCLEGFDVVSACPQDSGHMMSGAFYRIYNKHSSSQYRLCTEAFRILSRRGINRVGSMSKTLLYRKAVYANCGLPTSALYYEKVADLPVAKSEERMSQRNTAIDALILYTDIAFKYSMRFSVFMLLITVATAFYALITYLTIHPVAGWTTTLLFVSLCFFGVSLLLTILIRYSALILRTVFTHQKYVVRSIDKYGN